MAGTPDETGVLALERDGATIRYAVHGTDTGRPPLLLTHGYGASAAMWQPNLAALGAGRLVITWDICGHGRSDSPANPARYSQAACVDDMAAVLDACGASRAVIGGLSLGGYLSLAFWLRRRARVTALLLCDTGPGFRRDEAREEWNARAVARAQRLERDGAAALGDSPETRGIRQDPRGLALAARGILAQRDARVITSLPAIAVPTLVVVGAADTAFLGAAGYLATKIPGASQVVIDGAGHAANLDQPGPFNSAVVAFLDGLP
ncbi:MAG: alpha/beta fold hydrolase [Actinomycetota bacterium]